jgi:hypothetical protein
MPCRKSCRENGDVRGMCFTCIGDLNDMTVRELKEVAWNCPNTPYAMAYWLHNNHHEVWEKLNNDLCQEPVFQDWLDKNHESLWGLELIYKNMDDDNTESFWNFIDDMEKDEDEETVYDYNNDERLNEDGSCKGCNKCPKDD